MWSEESVTQVFKDATIVPLHKCKGDRSCVDNYRGVALLTIAGKILSCIILNCISSTIANNITPESQCGFHAARGMTDMMFSTRQLQEKSREQHCDLYMVFVDLTKAFDLVSPEGLRKVLYKVGCPAKLVNIIRSFHDGMVAHVRDSGCTSEPFPVTIGTNRGCFLAPLLLALYFSLCFMMLLKIAPGE